MTRSRFALGAAVAFALLAASFPSLPASATTALAAAHPAATAPIDVAGQVATAVGVTFPGIGVRRDEGDPLPRVLGGAAPGEFSAPGYPVYQIPQQGRRTYLLELNTPSTWAAYNSALAQGRAAAAAAAKHQLEQVKSAQARLVAALPRGSAIFYRMHTVLAGVAVATDVRNVAALRLLPGVRAIYSVAPKRPANASSGPLMGDPPSWSPYGDLGKNSTIAIIDSGIDYTNPDFGGPGTTTAFDNAVASADLTADPKLFPNNKVVGGYDFVGTFYRPTDPASLPLPDANPFDGYCGQHGTPVAAAAAGLGVTSTGATFDGPYNASTDVKALRIKPGVAPAAKLLAYRVSACGTGADPGSSTLVSAGIDRAADPNDDGDPSDHATVINISMESVLGSPQDGDSVAADAVSALGIPVVAPAGNGGDNYDIGGSPGNAKRSIAVANSVDASSVIDSVKVTAPAGIAKTYGAERSVTRSWENSQDDLAGQVGRPTSAANADGCDPFGDFDAKIEGKIAFLEWSDDPAARRCDAETRTRNALAAGAIGFVLADDRESFVAPLRGYFRIAGVMVPKSVGDLIRSHLTQGVVIGGTSPLSVNQILPGMIDTINDTSSRGIGDTGNVKPDVTAVGTTVFAASTGTGHQGQSYSGTSMAAAMVTGLAALVQSAHPGWSAEQVKADIVNTAGQDLYPGENHTGVRYAPNRVGAGRIEPAAALDTSVLAMVLDDPGAVSASFGPVEVTGPTTMTKTIAVVNKGSAPVTYRLGYQSLTAVPGAAYRLSEPAVTVGAHSSSTFAVSLVIADPSKLTKTIDPTVGRQQFAFPRAYRADTSGRIVLTPTSGTAPRLRVPVYAAPRPASSVTQPASISMPGGVIQNAILPLSGRSVQQGVGATSVTSTIAGFELQAVSGLAPLCSTTARVGCVSSADQRDADLRYVGTTSNAPQLNAVHGNVRRDGRLYFSVSTQGAWRTAAGTQEFDVVIDIDGDTRPDVVLYNTRYAGQDVMVSELIDLDTHVVLDIQPINDRPGDVDTALMDSDTMVLPVAISALPALPLNGRIGYGVVSFSNQAAGPTDSVDVGADGRLGGALSVNPFSPGIAVYGKFDGPSNGLLYRDSPGTLLQVRRDSRRYFLDRGLGVLMVHFHNKVGNKAQVVELGSTSVAPFRRR